MNNEKKTSNIKPAHSFSAKVIIALTTLMCCGLQASAQWHYPSRDIITVASPNGRYYATTTPARSLDITMLGKTEVFDSRDSQMLYSFPVCLAAGSLFVSNDGRSLLHLMNRDLSPNDEEPRHAHCFTLYRDGNVAKQLTLKELTGCDKRESDCQLYYNVKYNWTPTLGHRDSLISQRPAFADGDTVFVYTSQHNLLRIHLPSGQIDTLPYEYHSVSYLQQIAPQHCDKKNFRCPSDYVEEEIRHQFARRMRMVPQGDTYYSAYKYYHISALLRIGRDGKAEIFSLDNRDSLSEAKIRRVIEGMTYNCDFPDGIDYWYCKLFESMHKRNKLVARREGKQQQQREQEEYQRRLVADSIDGVYIPRNIEDCFTSLDSILWPKDRKGIINETNRDAMSKYHFGLGMWLRNNWGLWAGSRLQTYMEAHGVYHPDNMSGAILEYYYDHLHSQDSAWRAFDTTLVPPPPPDTATMAVPRYRIADRQLRRVLRNVIKGTTGSEDPEDDEDTKLKRKSYCYISLVDIKATDTTLFDDIRDLADSAVAVDLQSSASIPQALLKLERFEYDYQYRPIYGYIIFRGRYFLLTEQEISPAYFKKTNKSKRYWKPRKYFNYEPFSPKIVYIRHNGKWRLLYEL